MSKLKSPSDALFAAAATGLTIERPAHLIGPTVAAYGIAAGSTGTRADLLLRDDIVDAQALHSHVDRCRVAEDFEGISMNLPEPEGRFWNLFTPWQMDDGDVRKKNFRRSCSPAGRLGRISNRSGPRRGPENGSRRAKTTSERHHSRAVIGCKWID